MPLKVTLRRWTDSSRKHVHLPKLVQYDLIVWNQDTNGLSRGAKFDEIKPILELWLHTRTNCPKTGCRLSITYERQTFFHRVVWS